MSDAVFQADYVRLIFNGGEATLDFSNDEILGDIEYVPGMAPEILQSITGKGYSLPSPQLEYFSFNLNYQSAETRIKFETMRQYMIAGYTCQAEMRAMIIPFSSWPIVSTNGQDDFEKLTATFAECIIELPQDFAFDRIGRGMGSVQIDEVPIKIIKSGNLPTANPCSEVSMGDFVQTAWDMTGSVINGITISLNPGGLIASIDSFPNGTIYTPSGFPLIMVYDPVDQRYEAQAAPVSLVEPGSYKFRVDLPVTLASPAISCTARYEQFETIASTCSQLDSADWAYGQWNVDDQNNDELIHVPIGLNGSGLINSIDGYPEGELRNPSGALIDIMSWNGSNYAPLNGPIFLNVSQGDWTVTIPNIPVTLNNGQQCSHTFTDTYTVSGSFMATGYNPVNSATGVVKTIEPSITFNQSGFGLDTGTATLYRYVDGTNDVAIQTWDASTGTNLQISGNTITFQNAPDLQKGALHYMIVPAGFIIDPLTSAWGGVVFGQWLFTVADNLILTRIPSDDATSAPLSIVPTLQVQQGSGQFNPSGSPTLYLRRLSDDSLVKSWVVESANSEVVVSGIGVGQEWRFTGATLQAGVSYYIHYDFGIILDQHGDEIPALIGNTGWNWTMTAPANAFPYTFPATL